MTSFCWDEYEDTTYIDTQVLMNQMLANRCYNTQYSSYPNTRILFNLKISKRKNDNPNKKQETVEDKQ